MQRISRAGDVIWRVSAFDPRKPVDPDWAFRPPKPTLRSPGDRVVLEGGPEEHHQADDSMQWSPSGHGALEDFDDDDFDGMGSHYPSHPSRPEMPESDMSSIDQHNRVVREADGVLNGSEGHYVEYHPTSSVNHYYTYNPRSGDDWEPWNLVSTHWALRDPIQTRHQTFDAAVDQGKTNRSIMDRQVDNLFGD